MGSSVIGFQSGGWNIVTEGDDSCICYYYN